MDSGRPRPQTIIVRFVIRTAVLFSVQPDGHGSFLLKIDAHFILHLDDEERRAAIAHELGHVWIYTHHPFLHTEALLGLRLSSQPVTVSQTFNRCRAKVIHALSNLPMERNRLTRRETSFFGGICTISARRRSIFVRRSSAA
jgi:hypothetical protein